MTSAPRSESVLAEVDLNAKEQAQCLLHRLVPGQGVCNYGVAVRVETHLRWWPLAQALNQLMRRHPALRTVLRVDGAATARRFLGPETAFPLATGAATEADLATTLADLVSVPFDLGHGREPLVRAQLLLLPNASVLCLVLHHLVGDLTTTSVLLRELAPLYDGFAAAGEAPADLAGMVSPYQEPPPDQASISYWVRQLAGIDPASLTLAGARPISGRPTFAGAWLQRWLPAESLAAVARIRQRSRLTENMVLLAAYCLLLAGHGAGPDLVIGVPVDGRGPDQAGVVGYHVNTLPLRLTVDRHAYVADLLGHVSTALLTGLEHSDASFESIQPAVAGRSADWRVPLFRHMYNYRPFLAPPRQLAGRPATVSEAHPPLSRLDLEWIVYPTPTGTEIAARYSTEVHDQSFVQALMERYDAVLVGMAAALDRPVRTVSMLTAADQAVLARLHRSGDGFPGRTLLAEVQAQAGNRPDAPAVHAAGTTMTYARLLTAADAVRRTLLAEGLRPGDPVGLCAARRPELAAAALGVWAAGGVYLPLDPAHPAHRRAAQLSDAGAQIVLGDGLCEPDPRRQWLELTEVCGGRPDPADPDPLPSWPEPDPGSAAYLIYTSGSTGQPKGVEVSHANLANLVRYFETRLGAGPSDRTLWLTTFSFDISALELLLPLVTGGTSVIASDQDRTQPRRLLDLVEAEGITILQATPTTWRQVAGQLGGQLRGRTVLCGGEPLEPGLAEQLLAGGCRLFNVYGPTETTIWSTVAELSSPVGNPVPIGEPIAGTSVHILDQDGEPVPPGQPGELCISGAGVAIGYRDQPALTAERFRHQEALGRYYRTGDQVRLGRAGLVFLGRDDRQVKVRGHRIELSEVEGVLASHPAVRAAAVVVEPDGAGHLRLVAAIQAAGEPDPPAGDALRELATARLPSAAVPSRYVFLPELPTTGNGKTDYQALTQHLPRTCDPAQLPPDPVVRTLTTLWRQVLKDDRLDAEANFFLHGGHSLLAVELADRVAEALDTDVAFDAVFHAPSPGQLAAWLATAGR